MFDVRGRIEELETRRKELIMQAHTLRDTIERAESFKQQLAQTDKELAWLAGALDALKVWQEEEKVWQEDEKPQKTLEAVS